MLGRNLIASVLTQIPVFVMGVMAGVFSTRFLGEDAKGIYTIFQANTQLFVLIFSLGMQTGIVFFISSKKIADKIILGICMRILFLGSVLLFTLLALMQVTNLFQYISSEGYSSFLYVNLLFMMFLFSIFCTLISSFFQAYSKFKTINLVSIINSVANCLIFLSLFLAIKNKDLEQSTKINYALYCTIFSFAVNSIIWIYFYKKELNIKPDYNFTFKYEFKTFITYSLVIFLGTLINFFNYRIDLWIVNYYSNDLELSFYSLASNISQIILYVSVTIGTVILPFLSTKNIVERIKIFPKITRYSFSFFLAIVVMAYLISDYIIPIVYGNEFYDSVKPFKILLPGILFSCFTQLLATLVVASKKNMLNIIATSIGLLFTILLDFILIPLHGIVGAAWATTISYWIIFIITFYLILSKLNYPLTNYFIINRKDIKLVTDNFKK